MASGSGWNLWVWLAGGGCGWKTMDVSSGCGFKEVYRFPHITYPYILLLYLLFFAATSQLKKKFFRSCSATFC